MNTKRITLPVILALSGVSFAATAYINQIGYRTSGFKELTLFEGSGNVDFVDQSGQTVLSVTPSAAANWDGSGQSVQLVDFSELKTPGTYTIKVNGQEVRKDLKIADNTYGEVSKALLRKPDCKDYKPLNVYGQTKLEGELAVSGTLEKYFIVRIAWVFGLNGKNFIKTMLNVGKTHDTVRVVNDQIGTPTYTLDLSRLLIDMNETEKYGYYHATNEGGFISWYDFTCEIFKQAGYSTKVVPVTTAEYGLSKAARPFNSRLDKSKLVEAGFKPLPTWQDALARYLKELS